MRFTTAGRLVLGAGLVCVGLAPAPALAAAVPATPETGCPTAYQLLSLDDLEAEGYVFAPDLDANGDRFICGKPLNPVVQAQVCLTFPGGVCPVPVLYSVRDNDVAQR
jgi:hypothetical protein